ncbi:MAG: hypothetical protein R3344_03280 [Acidobacteriota bacterium]|nr:hypothetical protein [Acidobacteriota bacterium]
MRKLAITGALAVAAVTLLVLTPVGEVVSREFQEVMVLNFPDPQPVTGSVKVDGPIRMAELQAIERVTVPPVKPSDTNRLIDAGTIVTDGYTDAVLSLAGQVKGQVGRGGTIGALLIPEVTPAGRAFQEKGQILFPLEVEATAEPGSTGFFGSDPTRRMLGFPSYRVFLYNTTDQSVGVDLYAYLTSR